MATICNLCGSSDWEDMNSRKGVRCKGCGSVERTRAAKMVLDSLGIPAPGSRVLHFAPEKGLSGWLEPICGDAYDPVDLEPKLYPHAKPRKFNIVTDVASLPDNSYDLILHLHVLEHIPCNISYILFHFHRALKPNGKHVFAIPLMKGYYEEYFGPMDHETATRRFGQYDHVRRFGTSDLKMHLGSILELDYDYSLYKTHTAAELDAANIPPAHREGLSASTIFVAGKYDYRLRW